MMESSALSNRDIVCVGLPTWEGNYGKAVVNLMSELALTNRVLYVDYAHTWKDVVCSITGKHEVPVRRMFGIDERLRTCIAPNGAIVYVLTPPPVLPINWISLAAAYSGFLQLNAGIVGRSVRNAMRTLEFSSPIVVNAFNPFLGVPLAGRLDESLLVYYCYDEIGAAQWAKVHGKRLEEKMLRLADGVIATSSALANDRAKVQPRTYLVNNGVDFAHFHSAWSPNKSRQLDKTVVGYVGSIDDRLDYDLLQKVFRLLPDVTFRFIGRVTDPGFSRLLSRSSNVEFLGPMSVSDLPAMIADFDLAIIPFALNEFTRNIYPLKINEYLAGGKPVVMTPFADLSEFETIAGIAETPEAFAEQIRTGILSDSTTNAEERITIARRNSWGNRANDFSNALSDLLRSRESAQSSATPQRIR